MVRQDLTQFAIGEITGTGLLNRIRECKSSSNYQELAQVEFDMAIAADIGSIDKFQLGLLLAEIKEFIVHIGGQV